MWATTIITTLLISAGAVTGRPGWHLDGLYPLASEQLDTIVSPNAQSSHMHRIFGSSAFKAAFNFDDNRAASCSSVEFQADMSNYWMPQLYWIDTLGSTTKFAPLGAISRVYYFMPTNSVKSNVTAFPDGLRILAGNPNAKTNTGQYAFSCQRNREMTNTVQGTDFNFDMDCPFGMKTNMYYQNCWNGKDLWLPNNAHMSYPSGNNYRSGPCPWSHPVRVPTMMLEVTWQTSEYAPGQSLKGHLAWANGDTTGFGFHADFTNGWDRDVFIEAMNSPECVGDNDDNMSMGACPVFARSQDRAKAQACRPTAGTLQEPTGVSDNVAINALPGCNPLWGATGAKPTCNPSVPGLDVSRLLGTNGPLVAKVEQQAYIKMPTTPGWHRLGCVSTNGLTNQISFPDGGKLTQERCTESCLESGYYWAGVGNHADTCYCGTGIYPGTAHQEGMCTNPCPGNSTQTCGGEYIIDLFYATPDTKADTQGRELTGCYSYGGSNSLKNQAFYNFFSASLTTETCLQACVNRNATWAMTQAGNNCFCGNNDMDKAVASGGNYVPSDTCNKPCGGNQTQICGGQYVGSLFNMSNSPISQALPDKPAGWLGCWNGGGNALQDVTWLNNSLTVASCVNGCSEMGYKYGGVSVGNRCQCGNVDTKFGARLPASECTTACRGNATQTCGAAYNVEIYDVAVGAQYKFADVQATYPDGWTGCYASTGSNLQLTDYSFSSNSMTIDTCKSGCKQFGYNFAGVQNKNVCYCGSAPTSRLMPHENCNFPCGGDNTQFCGASSFMDVYDITNLDTSGSSASASYVGCYQDGSNPRGLGSYMWSGDNMTKDNCRTSCKELGPYSLAGLENGNQCYCGNTWAAGKILPDSSCSTPCKGNSTQTCGGSSTAAVYNTTKAPDIYKTKPVGWVGCWPSSAFTAAFYSSGGMTNAACKASCARQGYAYSGVRSGTNCYCAQTLPDASKRNPGINCNQPCAGNATETCGAAYLVDASDTKTATLPPSGYMGCFIDGGKLNSASYTSTYMTLDTCNQFCMARSFPFSIIQQGNRCRCGSDSPVQSTTDATCNTPCTGDSTINCGGGNVGSVFKLTGTNTPTKFDLTTTASDGYAGCYAEGQTKLATLSYSLNSNTPLSCQATCKGLGKAISGTENGKECYCGDSLDAMSGGYRVADSECNSACPADASAKCGGYARLSVRLTAGAQSASSSNGAEGNIGCYETGSAIAKAGYDTTSNQMSTDLCRRSCRIKGFSAASLTNGNRCMCGSLNDVGNSLPATMCYSACVGNSAQTCGGPAQVAVYDTKGPGAMAPSMAVAGYAGCFTNDNPSSFAYQTSSSANSLTWCSRLCTSMSYSTFGVSGIYCGCGTKVPAFIWADSSCSTKCPVSGSTDMCGGSNKWSLFTSNTASITTPAAPVVSSTTSTSAAVSTVKTSSVASSAPITSSTARVTTATASSSTTSTTASSAKVSSTTSSAPVTVPTTAKISSAPVTSTTTSKASSAAASVPTSATSTSKAVSATTAAATTTLRSSLPINNGIVTDSTTAAATPTGGASSDPSNKGCFAVNKNVMSAFEMKCSTLDPSMCKLLCRYKGFAYAAVTNGDTCLCGSTMTGLTSSANACTSTCTGDAKTTCGGSTAMQVFTTSDMTMPAMSARKRKAPAAVSPREAVSAQAHVVVSNRRTRGSLIRKIRKAGGGLVGRTTL